MAEGWGLGHAGFQYRNCVGKYHLSVYIPLLLEINSGKKVYLFIIPRK